MENIEKTIETIELAELQKKVIEIFEEIDKICTKYNLRYFAIGGTCLGAVRHGGFIPWDDDLDIAMPRKDYERLKKIAKEQLPNHLKIFDVSQGKHYNSYFMKIYNCNTTFIEKNMSIFSDRYTGVYIDIMPLDGIPSKKIERKIYFMKLKQLARLDWHRKYVYTTFFESEKNIWKRLFWSFWWKGNKRLPDNYFSDKYVQLQKKYSYDDSKDLCYTWSKRASQVIFPKSDFKDYVLLPFEDTQMRCPVGYDNFLTVLFGDYMKLPPEEERVPCHETDIIDLERPYTYYIKEEG